MCGVFGYFSSQNQLSEEDVLKRLELISHRGPDSSGVTKIDHGKLVLGHTRLAIIDLSEDANQPMESEAGSLVYNGEIYNYKDIAQGATSDTQVLFDGLLLDREKFLAKCQGMYAGSFFDNESSELMLFRDTLGIKPLYFFHDEKKLIFASEIKLILSYLDVEDKAELDLSTIRDYIEFENYGPECTFFKNIKALPLGGWVKFKIDQSNVVRTSQGEIKYKPRSKQESDLEEVILDSVKSHLVSDVPISTYMSGGIDSTLVSVLARKELGQTITAFTGFFNTGDSYYSELPLAEAVAKKANIELVPVEIRPEHFVENFDELVNQLDQPRMGMGSLSQYVVASEVSKSFKVVLSGHGGDELFFGYPLFLSAYFFSPQFSLQDKLRVLLSLNSKSSIWFFYSAFRYLKTGKLSFAPSLNELKNADTEVLFSSSSIDKLADLKKYYKEVYLPGLLAIEDHISMKWSLETRMPLWSQEIVDHVSRIDSRELMAKGRLKHMLIDVAKKHLPEEIFRAKKRGFPTPLRLWFKDELSDFVESRLDSSTIFKGDGSREKFVGFFKDFSKKKRPFALDEVYAHRIWIALCLDSWSRSKGIELRVL